MKQHKNELDVDVIGGEGSLTKEEEKAISQFLKTAKERRQKKRTQQKVKAANKSIADGGTGR